LEYHGVFGWKSCLLRVTPCPPWLFFFGIIRFFCLDNLLAKDGIIHAMKKKTHNLDPDDLLCAIDVINTSYAPFVLIFVEVII
jgi:hypothetical protein